MLYFLIHAITPFLVPVCFFCAWTLIILVVVNLWTALRDGVTTSRRLHQIPCTGCQFFTGDYRLKCTVQPSIANSEAAIDCLDYQPTTTVQTFH